MNFTQSGNVHPGMSVPSLNEFRVGWEAGTVIVLMASRIQRHEGCILSVMSSHQLPWHCLLFSKHVFQMHSFNIYILFRSSCTIHSLTGPWILWKLCIYNRGQKMKPNFSPLPMQMTKNANEISGEQHFRTMCALFCVLFTYFGSC